LGYRHFWALAPLLMSGPAGARMAKKLKSAGIDWISCLGALQIAMLAEG